MRFFISFDMEGVAAVANWPSLTPGKGPDYLFARKQATAEVNAVIRGLAAGAAEAGQPVEEIVVADSHAEGLNLLPEELDPTAMLVRGYPRPNYMVEGLDSRFDLAAFVGYHARIGTRLALMDHSYSGGAIREVRLNGQPIGETGLNAAYAGHYGVPLGLVSGDAALAAEVREQLGPQVVCVTTKTAISRFATVGPHPARVLQMLEEGARESVRRRERLPVFRAETPCTLEVELAETLMADLLEVFPGFERRGGREIVITQPAMPELYRAFMGLLLVCWAARRAQER